MPSLLADITALIEPYAFVEVGLSSRSAEAYAPSIEAWVQDAVADMRRVGVDDSVFAEDSDYYPIARAAVLCKVKALFGRDNPNAECDFFEESYRQHVIDLLNSGANSAARRADDVLE